MATVGDKGGVILYIADEGKENNHGYQWYNIMIKDDDDGRSKPLCSELLDYYGLNIYKLVQI